MLIRKKDYEDLKHAVEENCEFADRFRVLLQKVSSGCIYYDEDIVAMSNEKHNEYCNEILRLYEKERELSSSLEWYKLRYSELKHGTELQRSSDGDIYLNPCFGDLWILQGDELILINDGYSIDIDDPVGFIKVGHVDDVITQKKA